MTPQEVVQRFAAELNANKYSNATTNVGTAIIDDAVRASSNFASTQDVITAMKADQVNAEKLAVEEVLGSTYAGKTMSDSTVKTLLSNAATDTQKALSKGSPATVQDVIRERKAYIFLENFCGIQLNDGYYLANSSTNNVAGTNVDTGAITGSDANLTLKVGDTVNGSALTAANLSTLKAKYGSEATLSGDTLIIGTGLEKTAENVMLESGSLNVTTTTNFTTDGLTIQVGDGTTSAYNNLTDKQKQIVASLKQWWTQDSIDLNKDSYNLDFTDAKITDINLTFDDTLGSSTLATITPDYRDDGTITQLNLKINSTASGNLNRAVANELSRAVIAANVNNFNKLPQFVKEGLAEITHGVDDERGKNLFMLAYNDSQLNSALSLTVSSTTMDKPSSYTYPAGYMFMRYLAKQGAEQTLDDDIAPADINATVNLGSTGTYYVSGNSTLETASTSKQNISLGTASGSNYTIAATPVKQTVNTGNTARKVANINSNATVIGGTGNDTLEISEGTFVNAGDGNNSIKVSAQYATISAGTGNDSVTVDGGGYNSINLGDGKNRISLGGAAALYNNSITTGAGDDTITDAAKKIHHNYHIDTGAGNDTLSLAARNSTINTGAGNDSLSFLTANDSGNYVDLGDGNDYVSSAGKNNTLTATGNNTVASSGGNNYFLFDEGNNSIKNFQSTDTLAVNGVYNVATTSGGYLVTTANSSINVAGSFNSLNNIINIGDTTPADTTPSDTTPADTTPADTTPANVGVTINNSVSNTLITGTAYSDTINNGANGRYHGGSNVTINALASDDDIFNFYGDHVSINTGTGNDTVYTGVSDYVTVEASAGGDKKLHTGNSKFVLLKSGAGNDTIWNYSSNVTIDAGAGNDTILNNMTKIVSINAGAGNDTIDNTDNDITINAGAGDDKITLATYYLDEQKKLAKRNPKNNLIQYANGDGHDTVWGFDGTDTLQISGAPYSSTRNGYDILFTVGNGSVLLKNVASLLPINVTDGSSGDNSKIITLTEGNDTYVNNTANVTINALAGDDFIDTGADNVSINTGDGSDTVKNWDGENLTVSSGAGDDFIDNIGMNAVINTGTGDDSVFTQYTATVTGGKGNDTARINTVEDEDAILTFNHATGDGDDLIEIENSFAASGRNEVVINLTSGTLTSTTTSGEDIILTVGNEKISITGLDCEGVIVKDSTGKTTVVKESTRVYTNWYYVSPAAKFLSATNDENTYLRNWGDKRSITGGKGDDTITSNGANNTIIANGGDDRITLGASYNSSGNNLIQYTNGDGHDTVWGFGATDTLSITGAPYTSTKSGNDILFTVGDGSVLLKYGGTISPLNIANDTTPVDTTPADTTSGGDTTSSDTTPADTTPTDNPNIVTLTEFVDTYINDTEGVSIRALDGNDTLTNTAASVSVDGMGGDDKILNSFVPDVTLSGGDGDDFLANYGENSSLSGGDGNDEIYNFNSNVTISGDTGDDKISLYSGADGNIIQYDAAHSEGNDTVWGFTAEDSLVIDNTETFSSLRQGNDLLVNVDNGSVLLIDFFGDGSGSGGNLNNISLPATATDTTPAPLNNELTPNDDIYTNRRDNVTLDALTGNDNLINYGKNISLDAAGGKDSVYNYGEGSTILGNAGDDLIDNKADAVTIDAGNDNDSVINSGSNVTISGGLGNDSVTLSPDAKNVVLEYFSGDGNDTVWGFTPEDSLVAYGNSFNTIQNGNDISVSVDGSTILLIGAATLPTVNFGNQLPSVSAENLSNSIAGAQETLSGNDSITNTGDNASIDATGNNFVDNSGDNASINATGNASIDNSGTGAQINTGNQPNVVDNSGEKTSIVAGGNDSISNTAPEVSIVAGDSVTSDVPEVIDNWGDSVTVDATLPVNLTNYGDNPSISTGEKADLITNEGNNPTISTGDGNDLIQNTGDGEEGGSLDAGAGDDTVTNTGKSITVTGGKGNDSITNTGDGTSLSGGKGDDTIKNSGKSITITGGKGNDLIQNEGDNVVIEYNPADGNDTVTGFNETSTLSIGGGNVDSVKSGDDLIIYVNDGENEGSITLIDAASLPTVNIDVDTTPADTTPAEIQLDDSGDDYQNNLKSMTVTGGNGDDSITNTADSVNAAGGKGNDSLTNTGNDTTLVGGDGNDTLYSAGADNVSLAGGSGDDSIYIMPVVDRQGTIPASDNTVSGGDGNDFIYDTGAKDSSIDGGSGKDFIIEAGKDNTIHGGEDDDRISLKPSAENTVIDYSEGDGNDTVYGFNETSTLHVGDESHFTTTKSGDDIVVEVGTGDDAGSITLIDAASLPNPIITGENPVNPLYQELTPYDDNYTNKVDDATLDAMTGNDTLNIYGNRVSLDAAGGNDLVTSYGKDVTIRGGKESDAKNGDIANFVDNGAGNDTITSNGDNAVLDGGDGDDQFISNGDNAFIVGGLGNDSITLSPDAKNNIIEFVTGDGDDTVWGFTPEDSLVAYGYSLVTTRSGDNGEDILLTTDNGTVLLKNVGGLANVNIAGAAPGETPSILPDTTPAASQENSVDGAQVNLNGNDSVNNTGNHVVITGSDGNNDIDNTGDEVSINSGEGNDTVNTTGDSVSADGGAGADNINNTGGSWVTMTGGEGDDTIFSTSGESISPDGTQTVPVSADNPSIDGGAGKDFIVNEGDNPSISGGDGDDTITNSGNDGELDGGAGKDNIVNKGQRITLTGNDGGDNINTTGDSVSADGGKGDDTITAGGKAITLTGGQGSDEINLTPDAQAVIEYNPGDGDDTINGFNANDTLSISGGTVDTIQDGDDIIVSVDDGSITLVDAASLPAPNIVRDSTDAAGKVFRFTEQADTYANTLEGATLLALAGDDKLDNFAPNVSINSYAGNNLINNRPDASNVTVETGDGKDSIYNWEGVSAPSIDAGNGDNYIYNDAANGTLKTGDGNDKFVNYQNAAGTFIDAGAGSDTIQNNAADTTINAGAGDDLIKNSKMFDGDAGKVSINAGDGDDSITNSEDYVTIRGGAGNDQITLAPSAKNNLIEYITGDGNDTVWGFTPEDSLVAFVNDRFNSVKSGNDILVTIDSGTVVLKDVGDLTKVNLVTLPPDTPYEPKAGESQENSVSGENQTLGDFDSVSNTGNDLSITGGAGDNFIENKGQRVTITGNDGADTVDNSGTFVTADGGSGKDELTNTGNDVTISGGSGDDTLSNKGRRVTLTGDDGSDSLDNTGSNVSVDGGAGSDTLTNRGGTITLTGGSGNDNLENSGTRVTLTGDEGNDILTNTGDSVSADGGTGDDSINNTGNTVTLTGGSGSDTLVNSGTRVTLTGDDGSDNLANTGDSVSANGGSGNDTLQNDGNTVTLTGGSGDDSITNTGDNVQIDYTSGDGSDTVTGFKENSTLSVAGGEVSSTKSGDDVIVNVDDGSITLKDAATLANVNIIATDELPTSPADTTPAVAISLTPEDDVYKNEVNNVTLLALSGDDKLENYGTGVSIDGMAGEDTISNYADDVTISGGDDADTLGNSGALVSISGGDGADYIINRASKVTINPGLGDDSIRNSAQNVMIDYMTGDGNDTVWGFDNTVTLSAYGYEFSSVKSGNDILFTVDDGTLVLKNTASLEGSLNLNTADPAATTPADTTPASKYVELTEGDDTYSNTLDDATIAALAGMDTLTNTANNVSISGGKDADELTSDGDFVTVTAGMGDDKISLSADSDNVLIQYQTGDGSDTVWGFKENSKLSISGSGIESVKSGDDVLVTLNGGEILLKGAATLSKVNVEEDVLDPDPLFVWLPNSHDYYENTLANASIFGNAGNDTIVNSGDEAYIDLGRGYDSVYITGNDVSLAMGSYEDTVKIGEGVTRLTLLDFGYGNDVIELPEAISAPLNIVEDSLIAGNITIGGVKSEGDLTAGYEWQWYRGTAYYIKKDITGGAILSADGKTIRFVANKGWDDTVFSIKGLNPSWTLEDLETYIKVTDEGDVIIPDEALARYTISLSTGYDYNLVLKNEHPREDISAGWHFLDQTDSASLTSAGKGEGYYQRNSKTITFQPYELEVYASVTGFTAGATEQLLDENLSFDKATKTLSVKPAVVGENFSTNRENKVIFESGTYTGSYLGSTGRDTPTIRGTGLTVNTNSGNDVIQSSTSGGNIYVHSMTNGYNEITGFTERDTIKIVNGTNVYTTKDSNGKDVYVQTSTRDWLLLKDFVGGKELTVVDENGKLLIDKRRFYANMVVENGMIILDAEYPKDYYNATASEPAISAENKGTQFTLTGGSENNRFVGGRHSDWISPGAGNNTLTGGTGHDTFAYGGGNDTITDYGTGSDVLLLNAELSAYELKDDGTLILKVGSGAITILDGVGKKITYFDGTGVSNKTEIFTETGRYTGNKRSITLPSATKEYAAESSIYTVDGSLTNSVSIVGNTNSNVIIGSSGADTLNANDGNNSLTGGAGKDVFIIEKGYNTILDYTAEDKVFISSPIVEQDVQSRTTVYIGLEDRSKVLFPNLKSDESVKVTFTDGKNDSVRTYYRDKVIGEGGTTLLSHFDGRYTSYTAPASAPLIDASASGGTLIGGSEDNTIIGGVSTDVIFGGGGKNILIGGRSADTFVHTNGNDYLSDYGVGGADKISVTGASMTSYQYADDDLIISYSNNSSVTIPDRRGKEVYFMEMHKDGYVDYPVNVFEADGIFNKKTTAVTLEAATRTFNAENYSSLITVSGGLLKSSALITGNAKANQIFAGTAGATLNGGKGNDSLWGSTGRDTFIYESGDGSDVIYSYGNGDRLVIDGEFAASVRGSDLVFSVGSTANAITLKDYGAVSTFNVNGTNYGVSNGNLVKK